MKPSFSYISLRLTAFVASVIICVTAFAAQPFVVVIDPGHGGKDFGAIGNKTNEKTIVLAVGRLLGKKISDRYASKDVKVVFTRNNDSFVTLQGRADIANKAKGDLFISIHANSVDKRNRNRTSVNGTSVYTLGVNRTAKNLEVAQRENSVIVLENDYTERYQGFDPSSAESYIIFEMEQNRHMVQSLDFASKAQRQLVSTAGRTDKKVRQAGFWVLHATSMPAVLVELDFICNPQMEAFMASDKGQEKLASALFNAFIDYKNDYQSTAGHTAPSSNVATIADNGISGHHDDYDENEDIAQNASAPSHTEVFCIQFLTSKKALDPSDTRLKGITDAEYYSEKGLLKYYCGATPDFEKAQKRLRQLKKSFPDAFIIRMSNGKRVR